MKKVNTKGKPILDRFPFSHCKAISWTRLCWTPGQSKALLMLVSFTVRIAMSHPVVSHCGLLNMLKGESHDLCHAYRTRTGCSVSF